MAADLHAAFLADIIAHRDDDTPRLVYADWLQDNGDPERAEFIRVQCELDGIRRLVAERGDVAGPPAAIINGLADRERELLNGVCGQGVDALPVVAGLSRSSFVGRGQYGWHPNEGANPNGGIEARFRRGFVAHVTCMAADWWGEPGRPGHGPALVRAAPLEVMEISDREPEDTSSHSSYPKLWGFVPLRDPPPVIPPPERATLAAPVFGWLRGFLTDLDFAWYSPHWRFYPTAQAALAALSAACLAWAGLEECPRCQGRGWVTRARMMEVTHSMSGRRGEIEGPAEAVPCEPCHGYGRALPA